MALTPEDFNKNTMLKFVAQDLLLKRMYEDLGKNERTLKVLFNGEVLGDSIMENEYKKLEERE